MKCFAGLIEALQYFKKLETNDYFVIGLWDGIWDSSDPSKYFQGLLEVAYIYSISAMLWFETN